MKKEKSSEEYKEEYARLEKEKIRKKEDKVAPAQEKNTLNNGGGGK